MTTEIKKGNTIYSITPLEKDWFVFERKIQLTKNHSSVKECFSLNSETYEVYCNRTGKQTFGIKRYLNLANRIGKIFNKSLNDF